MRRLRERQAARLEAVPGASPRGDDGALLPAVEKTIEALQLGEGDAALAQVARCLAMVIDNAQDTAAALKVFGPQLRRVLESLGGTPASRARLPQKAPERQGPPSKLAQLRAAHAAHPAKRKRAGTLSRGTDIR
jgi:hypothetical protein